MDNLKQKAVKAISFDLINRFSRQGISFVLSIFLARLLNPQDFGLLAMVNVVIAIAGTLNDWGLGSALIQRHNTREEHYGSVFYFNILVGFILTSILFISAEFIAEFYKHAEIKNLIRVMSLTFILNSFCNVRRTWLRKHLNYSVITKASLVSMIVGGVVGVIMAFAGFGVWSLVGQTIISSLMNNLYIYYFTKWKPKLAFKKKALEELWGYGFYMFLSGLLNTIFGQLDNLIIGKLFTPLTLGFYYRSKSLSEFVNDYSSGGLISVLFPVLSSVQHDKERYKKIVYRSFHLINIVTFFLLGIMFLCAKDIIVLIFSEKWLPSVEYYRIMVLSGFIFPLSALLVNILSSMGNSKSFLRLEIIKKIVFAFAFVIGFYFGIKGFLYCLSITRAIALTLNIYYAAKQMQISIRWFYSIIWKYLLLDILILSGMSFFDMRIELNGYIIHLLVFSSVFSVLFFTTAKIARLEGYVIIRKELSKLNIPLKFNKY